MTTANQDRRRSPRIECHDVWLQVQVGDQEGIVPTEQHPTLQVRVSNISDSGICLISQERLELGQIVYFSDPKLPARGTVVWAYQSQLECKAGIHFCQ
ncbi:MAG: PilZ domain-containing protein [Proteobacteria bacterium]|nr:PilZ domain-containing protein [Desulfobulbaceae bacterium]MBU4151457.1 PilZ domain-containing protein [Pseudomonadota bacterium]MDP2104975.1 PilZ domain-containing protein [Desulfobulbaceae bacterium]